MHLSCLYESMHEWSSYYRCNYYFENIIKISLFQSLLAALKMENKIKITCLIWLHRSVNIIINLIITAFLRSTRRHLPRFSRLYLYLRNHNGRAFRGFKAFLYFRIINDQTNLPVSEVRS